MNDPSKRCGDCGFWNRTYKICTCPCVRQSNVRRRDFNTYAATDCCNCTHYVDQLLALAYPRLVAYPEQRCELCAHWKTRSRRAYSGNYCAILREVTSPNQACVRYDAFGQSMFKPVDKGGN